MAVSSRLLRCAILLLALAGVAPEARAEGEKVVLGQINLSFYAVTGAVTQQLLERLGHTVEVRQGAHEEIFPLLGRGEVDLLAAAWLPGAHASYWSRYADQAVELATLYDGARLYWAVPGYVPEEAVKSVADLVKPEVAARMSKTIQGIGAGSGLMMASTKMMAEYGLDKAGYTLRPGKASEWIEAFEKAVAERRWLIMPLWRPHYLNKAHKVRPLAEPKGILGGPDRAVLVGNKSSVARLPAKTVDALRRMRLDVESVTEMDFLVNVGGKSPADAAREWMGKNDSRIRGWLGGEKSD